MTEIWRRIYQELHATYVVRRFKNEDVWTENLDLDDLLDGRHQARLRRVDDFNDIQMCKELVEWVGRDRLAEHVGRAEMVVRIRSS